MAKTRTRKGVARSPAPGKGPEPGGGPDRPRPGAGPSGNAGAAATPQPAPGAPGSTGHKGMRPAAAAPAMHTDDDKRLPPPLELQRRYLRLKCADVNGSLSGLGEETLLLSLAIKPLRRGLKCAGLAVTWNAVLANTDPIPESAAFFASRYKIWEHIYPGCVFVYQPGGEQSSGHLGGMYSNMIAVRGAAGAVVDGNLRDSDSHDKIPNWAPFSRSTSPLEAAWRIKWMDCNRPILMSGELRKWVEVFPGDMVCADGDGVVIVPRRLILPVLEKAEPIFASEEKAEKEYAAGADPEEVQKKYGAA